MRNGIKMNASGKYPPYLKRFLYLSFFIIAIRFGIWYLACLPENLFSDPKSTVLFDKNGELLGAKIAEDGQWRFRESKSNAIKFERC